MPTSDTQMHGPDIGSDEWKSVIEFKLGIRGKPNLLSCDRKLSGVYAAAVKRSANERPPLLKAEQRGWIKGRNECWKSDDQRECVRDEYRNRIAELQARYRLVPGIGPVRHVCDSNPTNEVVVTFFQTDPQTLIAERGDSTSLMYRPPNDARDMYRGRNEIFQEHAGEALIRWGYGAAEMRCMKTP